MKSFVGVKPSPLAWVLVVAAPLSAIVGFVLLFGGHFGGIPCLVAALFNSVLSARILRQSRRMPPANTTSFVSHEVGWARGRFQTGIAFQSGWVVVRPGWVAFLPSLPKTTLLAKPSVVLGPRFTRVPLGALTYDFASEARQGMHVFDRTILDMASQQGRVVHASRGDYFLWGKRVVFRSDEKSWLVCDAALPDTLVAAWRRAKPQGDPSRGMTKAFALISAIPGSIGAVGGLIAYRSGAPTSEIGFGVGFWWFLVALVWASYFVALRRAKLAAAARP